MVTSLTTTFNIQKYVHGAHILSCVVYGSQNKEQLLPHTTLTDLFCVTEVGYVYCTVRAASLYKKLRFDFEGLKKVHFENFFTLNI